MESGRKKAASRAAGGMKKPARGGLGGVGVVTRPSSAAAARYPVRPSRALRPALLAADGVPALLSAHAERSV